MEKQKYDDTCEPCLITRLFSLASFSLDNSLTGLAKAKKKKSHWIHVKQ